jgi:FtsP/CotA-like multicopper oxidase with cupredoxin domain
MDHSKHTNQTPAVDAHAGHNMSEMEGMDHSAHSAAEKTAQKENSPKSAHDHSGADSAPVQAKGKLAKAGFGSNFDSSGPVKHLPSEQAAGVDMLSQAPASGLADPGIGLRDHAQRYGRKVLTYADLRSLHPTRDKREPSREIELHLTGNMHRYMWSINGISFASAQPLKLTYNERVRIILVNDTMMTHPIHLHGMWSELETGDPDYIPRKHTVIVQPGAKISYLVTADAKGRWAYHCHLLYHMLGMMRAVEVVEERTP